MSVQCQHIELNVSSSSGQSLQSSSSKFSVLGSGNIYIMKIRENVMKIEEFFFCHIKRS